MKNTIFISIASYLDFELEQTVKSLLQKSDNPKNIFLSIYSQDKYGKHPDIEKVCKKYGAQTRYIKDDFRNSRGTCFARFVCQQSLKISYKYYLQIDSHSIFIDHWDSILIKDYENSLNKWNRFIFSTYPLSYYYKEPFDIENSLNLKEYFLEDAKVSNCLSIVTTEHFSKYTGEYKEYLGDEYGEETNYIAAGFIFGYAKYFLEVPYDKRIYHSGEEANLSIRFYCNDIKIVCPPKNYLYHHFAGESCGRRKSHWSYDKDWDEEDHKKVLKKAHCLSEQTLYKFYNLLLEDDFKVKNINKYDEWLSFVKIHK